jgi:hypothetical protein
LTRKGGPQWASRRKISKAWEGCSRWFGRAGGGARARGRVRAAIWSAGMESYLAELYVTLAWYSTRC